MSTLTEKILANYFRDPSDAPIPFTQGQLKVKKIYEDVFTKLLEKPDIEDRDIVNYLQNQYGRSQAQAYIDLDNVMRALGNVRNASREWDLYTAKKMFKEAYALAKKDGKLREMISAADKYAKYTRLDQSPEEAIDWEKIQPPVWEPSSDPTILNIKGVPESPHELSRYKERLRLKYIKNSAEIEEAEVLEDE